MYSKVINKIELKNCSKLILKNYLDPDLMQEATMDIITTLYHLSLCLFVHVSHCTNSHSAEYAPFPVKWSP